MNCLLLLFLFAVCVLFVVECSIENIFKLKREASVGLKLLKDSTDKIHGRERRSRTSKISYIYLDNRSGRAAELWYRTPSKSRKWTKFLKLTRDATYEMFTFERDEWVALDAKTHETLEINGDTKYYKPESNTDKSRAVCIITRKDQKDRGRIEAFVETFAVVDKTVRDRFSSNSEVERYVGILLSLASDFFKHKSLTQHGLDIHIIPSKIHVQRHILKLDPSKKGNNVYKACQHMNKLEQKELKKFDHKLFLTRTEFGQAGYAARDTMCGRYSSCSIVSDHGFHAAFLIAHEIAHSLGLKHDDFRQYSRFIMAPFVDSLFHNHRWSPQSQFMMTKNIRKYTDVCLGNKPANVVRYQYPGVYFSFERQCDLEFADDYTAWQPTKLQRDQGVDACAKLKCNMPGEWSHFRKTTGSPALDGTKCGENEYCLSGKCQEKASDEIENQVVVTVDDVGGYR